MLVFAYCLSWGFAFVGLAAPNSETAQAMTFPLIFPLTFASAIFVPLRRHAVVAPGFANNQPVSQAPTPCGASCSESPVGNSVWVSLVWDSGPSWCSYALATRRYSRTA